MGKGHGHASIARQNGLSMRGMTGNGHKTIHSGSTFVRIKHLTNSMQLTKFVNITLRKVLSQNHDHVLNIDIYCTKTW